MTDPSESGARADALSAALAKLPAYPGVVYRGGSFDDRVAELYRPGDVLVEDAFTSASRNGRTVGNLRYVIVSAAGRSVDAFSARPEEAEVVFDRGTAFVVLTVEQVGARHVIGLADLPSDGSGLDVPACVERVRQTELDADQRLPGLDPAKEYFPVGIRADGVANVVDRRA